MAFENSNLSILAYANGFTLWHYTSADTTATIQAQGYFNEVSDVVHVGDIIIVNADTDGTQTSGLFVASSNKHGLVEVRGMGI